jgi:hypothetical protein
MHRRVIGMQRTVTWYVQEDDLVCKGKYPGMHKKMTWHVQEGDLVCTGGYPSM